jgi:hypothetical protein
MKGNLLPNDNMPQMALIHVQVIDDVLHLDAPNMPTVDVTPISLNKLLLRFGKIR